MTDYTEILWPVLMRTTIAVGVVGVVACLLLRLLRVQSPMPIRVVCCSVLVPGCILWQINLPVPISIQKVVPSVVPQAPPVVFDTELPGLQPTELNANFSRHLLTTRTHPPVVASDAATGNRPVPVPGGLVAGWGLGLLFLLLWSVAGYVMLWRRIRRLDPAESQWTAEWRSVLSRMNIRRPVRMLQSNTAGPLLFRTPREAVLVIPEDRWSTLTVLQRETVLLHEAAHLRRGDLWKSLAIRMLALPQWFNPLAWWSLRRFDEAAEWACDDLVRSAMTGQATDYARALVQLSTKAHNPRFVLSAADGRRLTARVRRLLSPNFKEEPGMKSLALCSMIVLISGLSALRPEAVADQQNTATALPASAADNNTDSTDLQVEPLNESAGAAQAAFTPDGLTDAATVQAATLLVSATNAQPGREAVVDMNFLFQNDPVFRETKEALQTEVEAGDTEMRETIGQLQAIQRQMQALGGDDEGDVREALETAVVELQTALQGRQENLRRRLVRAESEMYYTTYQRISNAIAEHAQENGIRLVRRRNVVAERNENLAASPSDAADPGIDLSNPQAVLQLLNRDIVYIADGPLDITQAVFERLTQEPGSSQDPTAN